MKDSESGCDTLPIAAVCGSSPPPAVPAPQQHTRRGPGGRASRVPSDFRLDPVPIAMPIGEGGMSKTRARKYFLRPSFELAVKGPEIGRQRPSSPAGQSVLISIYRKRSWNEGLMEFQGVFMNIRA